MISCEFNSDFYIEQFSSFGELLFFLARKSGLTTISFHRRKKMNFEDFKENFSSDVKDTLERRNGIEYEVDARTVEKMNSTYEALTVKPEGSVIGVNLNLTDIYKELENGADYVVLASKSADLAAEAIENRPDFDIASWRVRPGIFLSPCPAIR
jgi:hypothetical protein